jgi:pimeloyl-ACP methyl ester carboxylesterase
MAQEGYVVALPTHAFNLAIFSIDNGAAARALLARPPEGSVLEGHVVDGPMAVFGHSLGGVVATKLALRGDFQALGIMASYPDPADARLLPSLQAPTLLLAAADDCQAKLSQIAEARETLPDPKVLVVVPGATHFQFTDSDAPDVAKNCAPTAPLSEAHDKMARVTKAFLDVTLKGQGTLPEALTALEGVEVQ